MNDTTSNQTANAATNVEQWILLIGFMGFGNGLIGTVTNSAMAIGIIRTQTLRTRFYVMICYLVVARAITGMQSLVMVIHRTLRNLNIVNLNITTASCYLIQFHVNYSLTLEMVLLLTLVLDRILAIAAFKYYRTLTYKHANVECAIVTCVTVLAKIVPSWIGIDFSRIIACISFDSSMSPILGAFHPYLDTTLSVVLITAYIALILYVRVHFLPLVNQSTGQFGQAAKAAFEQHKKLLPVLTRIVLLHCGFNLTSRMWISSRSLFSPEAALRMGAYTAVFVTADAIANTIVLLAGNKELRKAAFPWCSSTQTAVVILEKRNERSK